MHRWRYPSLSLHGIEGAFSGSGAKTVIPRKVVGKFSIRLVPNMTPEVVSEQARGAGVGVWRPLCHGSEHTVQGPRLALANSVITGRRRSETDQR